MSEPVPRMSIGLPVYNGADYIEDALRSFEEQTFEDYEVVISDNASDDDTEKIVRDVAASDRRIRYHRSDVNIGANRTYNRTFRGELFKWAAHDDTLHPDYLQRCVEVLDDEPTVVLVHSDTDHIGPNNEQLVELARGYLGPDGYIEKLLLDETAATALASEHPHVRFDAVVNKMTVFYDIFGVGRREAFRNTLLMRQYYGADKVFLAEMVLQGRLLRIPEVLFHRRCHASASTRTSDLASLADWSDPNGGFAYYPLQMLAGFADAVRAASLPAATKARCFTALASKAQSPIKLLRGR